MSTYAVPWPRNLFGGPMPIAELLSGTVQLPEWVTRAQPTCVRADAGHNAQLWRDRNDIALPDGHGSKATSLTTDGSNSEAQRPVPHLAIIKNPDSITGCMPRLEMENSVQCFWSGTLHRFTVKQHFA
jgi:hypothetical protein